MRSRRSKTSVLERISPEYRMINKNSEHTQFRERAKSSASQYSGDQARYRNVGNGHLDGLALYPAPGITTPLYWYWLLIKAWWKQMLLASLVVVLLNGLLQLLLLPRWWEASAVLMPLTNETQTGTIASMMGGSGGSLATELQGLIGFQTQAEQDADEYMAIMQGSEFTSQLVAGHRILKQFSPNIIRRLIHP